MGWLQRFRNRIELTVDSTKIDSDLINFPLLIHLSDNSGIDNSDISFIFDNITTTSGSKKIAVTTDDGTTQCNVEIQRWTTSEAWLWANIPTIVSGSDTTLYFYYDFEGPDNTDYVDDTGNSAAQAVWNSDYKCVLHFNTVDSLDSTSNNNNAYSSDSVALVDTPLGKGTYYDGWTSKGRSVVYASDDFAFSTTGSYTVSMLVNFYAYTVNTDAGLYQFGSDTTSNQKRVFCRYEDPADDSIYSHCDLGVGWQVDVPFTLYENTLDETWYHIVITRSGGAFTKGYVNGVNETTWTLGDSGVSSLGNFTSVDTLMLGKYYESYLGSGGASYKQGFLDGFIDEFRVTDSYTSAEWVKADYYNNIDNLVTFVINEATVPTLYLEGYCYDQYSRLMTEPCRVIVSDVSDGSFVTSSTSSGSGYFNIPVTSNNRTFVVTYYKEGIYGLDNNIAGASFMTTTSGS